MRSKFDSNKNIDNKKSFSDKHRHNDKPRSFDKPKEIKVPTPCDVQVNLYKYTGEFHDMHMYTVTFSPEVYAKKSYEIFMKAAEMNGLKSGYAYDGLFSLVTTTKIKNWECEFEMHNKATKQHVRADYLRTVNMNDSSCETIAALENITKFDQRRRGYFVNKRTVVDSSSAAINTIDRQGIEIMAGLNATIKHFGGNYYINLDMAYLLFYQRRPLVELAHIMYRALAGRDAGSKLPTFNDSFWPRFEIVVRGVRLATTHRQWRQTLRGDGLAMKRASDVEFEHENGRMTVAEYFATTYAPLRYSDMPLVIVCRKKKETYIPLEVLEVVPAQRYRAQLNDEITTAMIGVAAKKPDARFQKINERARELAMLESDTLREFGMVFDQYMYCCKGVILPPPQILFGEQRKISVVNGGWNLRDVKACRGVSIPKWKAFVFARGRDKKSREEETRKMIRDPAMLRMAEAYGVNFGSDTIVEVVGTYEDYAKATKAPFNLVILSDKSTRCYESVKMHSETVVGVITQCVLAKNLSKLRLPAFLSNLLLKINTKMGGHNWKLASPLFGDKRTCLIGIDVNHPGVGDLESPSVACVVGSVDYEFGNYHTVLIQQARSNEIVSGLKDATRQILRAHFAATKYKPERVVIFRDGVGDSMFDSVFSTEVQAVRDCCKELETGYNPELNLIIAQKRHSVRFSSGGQNLMPGTIVDGLHNVRNHPVINNVVSTQAPIFDFYLSSHNAIQGTARSVRYITVLNDSGFNISDLQTSIYHLCHLYMRATKSVSVVPPIYYAHLGATRGKCYLNKNKDGAVNMHAPVSSMSKTLYYL